MPDDLSPIDAIADASVQGWLRRSSLTYLEACISLMLTHLSKEEVADILRGEAKMVEELG